MIVKIISDAWDPVFTPVRMATKSVDTVEISDDLFERYQKTYAEFLSVQELLLRHMRG